MMVIVFRLDTSSICSSTCFWHVSETLDRNNLFAIDVIEIQADGDELNYISRIFEESIPMPAARVASWFGDDAKAVAAYLLYFHGK